jgi:hypothetical protein
MAEQLSDADLIAELTRRTRAAYAAVTHGPPWEVLQDDRKWATDNAAKVGFVYGDNDEKVLETLRNEFNEGEDWRMGAPDAPDENANLNENAATYAMTYPTMLQVALHRRKGITPSMIADRLALRRAGKRAITLGLVYRREDGARVHGQKYGDVIDVVTADSTIVVSRFEDSRLALGRVLTASLYYPNHARVIWFYKHSGRRDVVFNAVCHAHGVLIEYDADL